MSQRATFSEIWYRVADLRPRLKGAVQVRRQTFRGRPWYVVEDPCGNQFFRLHRSAYDFVGRLDGRRSVNDAWSQTMARMGDEAPTQDEAVQLLGQLHAANLLAAEVPPDAEALFEKYRSRRRRELAGRFANLMAMRIPLFDPDLLLDRWGGIFGALFSLPGLVLLVGLLALGGYSLVTHAADLAAHAGSVLDPSRLPLLYLGLVLLKGMHEFGHAFACKRFARLQGGGGEIHAMGIVFLVLVPLPFVDVSSAWGLRNRWHRVLVGAAGVLVELGCAGIAAFVWASTGPGTVLNDLAYDFIWIAGVSTVAFNGNPLLRYDGYYMLSDLLEIPNLSMRSASYLYYLVKRHLWRVPGLDDPAESPAEARWLTVYCIASTAFRVMVCAGILFFLADRFFFLGVVLAAASAIAWGVVPLVRLASYLLASPELGRVRRRALATTAGMAVVVLALVGVVPVSEHCRVEGIAEPREMAEVRAAEGGFVRECSGPGARTKGEPLLVETNLDLVERKAEVAADLRGARVKQAAARDAGETALVQALGGQIAALEVRAAQVEESIASLSIAAPIAGTWVSAAEERSVGAFLPRGAKAGVVATLDDLVVRAAADQQTAARIIDAADRAVPRLRASGRPEQDCGGRIDRILPAGSKRLESEALGVGGGGTVQTTPGEKSGTEATERQFTIVIVPEASSAAPLRAGQRVVVRFDLPSRPLLVQWWQAVWRLIQRRFHV